MASQTDLRRGMRFRSVLSLSPLLKRFDDAFEAPCLASAGDREITADDSRRLIATSNVSVLGPRFSIERE